MEPLRGFKQMNLIFRGLKSQKVCEVKKVYNGLYWDDVFWLVWYYLGYFAALSLGIQCFD